MSRRLRKRGLLPTCHASSKKGSATLPGNAGVAQLAEQLFCKQQVTGSIPVAGSNAAGNGQEGDKWTLMRGRR
jgi:hypothetical protein